MSQSEIAGTARILTGEESMHEEDGSLNVFASMYLNILIFDSDFQKEVRAITGEHFDKLLQLRAREKAPLVLAILRSRPRIHAIESYVRFLALGCPLIGIPTEEFVSLDELGKLRHEAHLRSAKEASIHIKKEQPARGAVASAVLAGITYEEIGISRDDADACIDDYFGRKDPRLEANWQAHQAKFVELNTMLMV